MSLRFPYTDRFDVDGHTYTADEVITGLEAHISEPRRESIAAVVSNRTFNVVTVCDGLYDRGNVSAVMRSAEGFGFAQMHVLEMLAKFKTSKRVANGADKWLDLHRYRERQPCISFLKEHGYRIVATHLEAAKPIHEIDFTRPTAIVYGNERDGVSEEILEAADERVIIPMLGFAQSFNISVAAAVSLAHIVEQRRQRLGRHGDLNAEQQRVLLAEYYLRSLDRPAALLRRWRLG